MLLQTLITLFILSSVFLSMLCTQTSQLSITQHTLNQQTANNTLLNLFDILQRHPNDSAFITQFQAQNTQLTQLKISINKTSSLCSITLTWFEKQPATATMQGLC